MVDRDRHKGVIKPVGADPGFFLRGGAPQRNGVTDWWRKHILTENTKKKAFD